MDVNHAHLDNPIIASLTLVLLKFQDHNVIATNNSTSNSTDVTIAQPVNSQVTLTPSKVVSAECSHKTVILMVKSNSANNNATDVNHAHKDKHSTETLEHATNQLLDHNALVTNNTTSKPTNALTAQLVNSQETTTCNKMVFAELLAKTAIIMVKSNSANNNATDANHAHKDKYSTETLEHATNQLLDHNALATNNTTSNPTNALTAQSVNSQETTTFNKMVFAELFNKTVLLVDNNN